MHSNVPPELRALLDQERAIPPLSATLRARAMARARASLAGNASSEAAASDATRRVFMGSPIVEAAARR